MRILLLSPNQINKYNWGHQLFRDEIGRHNDVFFYGDGYSKFDGELDATKVISKYGPFDLLLTYGWRYTLPFQKIGNVKIPKCHIVIDLFPPHEGGFKGFIPQYKQFVETNKYDLFLYRQRCQSDYLKEIASSIPSAWLPFSVDIEKYRNLNSPKKYDVITSSTLRIDIYPNRVKVNKLVKELGLNAVTQRVIHEKYINCINQSKICIISTNVFNSPNMKFTEFTSCGSFVLSDKPADMDELGFKDGEHLVIYKNIKDLGKKIKYYLQNEKEREIIAKQGMAFTRKNHNNTIRVKEMINIIKDTLSI